MKYPLNIYVVWHPGSKIGRKIGEEIYSTFCRDFTKPLSRGLGIPVYFRNVKVDGGYPVAIDTSLAEKNAIILLIDEDYFLDDNFSDYTEQLSALADANTRLFPIGLFSKAHEIGCGLSRLQFIRALKFMGQDIDLSVSEDFDLALKKIKNEVLHDCARLLIDIKPSYQDEERDRAGSPVKLFLSHAKVDGEEIALRFKTFIEQNLKLDVFFDTVDIADGYDFSKQFEQHIENSALVVFHTDEYSSREWCRREVLIAKRQKSPIVVVHGIKEGEQRAFPYLGNMPTTTLSANDVFAFYKVVNRTLYQVLNNLYQIKLLKSYAALGAGDDENIIALSSPPELFNFIEFNKHKSKEKKLTILYPDPPLGIEEVSLLNELDGDIRFVTPINL